MFSVDPFLTRTYDRRHYHCWHLVCEAWLALTGEDIGIGTARFENLQTALVGVKEAALERVEQPVSPCIVILLLPGFVPHAGLYRNGRLLHIRETGARYERLADVTVGFAEVRYYAKRHTDQGPAGIA